MRSASDAMLAKIASGHTTFCTCFRFELNGGTVFNITDLDKDVVIGADTYKSAPGVSSTKIQDSWEFNPSNLELHMNTDSTSIITPQELRSGKFNRAKLSMFLVDYEALPVDLNDDDIIWIKRGTVGNILTKGNQATIEFRGLEQALKQNIVDTGSRFCRYTLGDGRCTKDLTAFTNTGSIVAHNGKAVTISYSLTSNYLANGYIELTSGPYIGTRFDVSTNSDSSIVLLDKPAVDLVGYNVKSVSGCDKTIDECQNKFVNVINFGGEPHVPTRDSAVTGKKGKAGSVNQSSSGGGK